MKTAILTNHLYKSHLYSELVHLSNSKLSNLGKTKDLPANLKEKIVDLYKTGLDYKTNIKKLEAKMTNVGAIVPTYKTMIINLPIGLGL